MNKSSLSGFLLVAAVFYYGIFLNSKMAMSFLDVHTLVIVIGGTIAAALIAFPFVALTRTVDYFLWGVLFKKKKDYLKVSQDIAGARNSFLINQNHLTTDECHPFLREAVLFLLNRNIDNAAFEEVLKNRSEHFRKKYNDDAKVLKSLTKYPLAIGFLASVVKIISVLQNVETSTYSILGSELAIAFVALFWGLSLSCFILFPLADSASKSADEDQLIRNLIIDGMILIRKKATDDYFQAYLRGYLNLSDRSDFKIFSNNKANFPYAIPVPKIEVPEEREEPSSRIQDELRSKDEARHEARINIRNAQSIAQSVARQEAQFRRQEAQIAEDEQLPGVTFREVLHKEAGDQQGVSADVVVPLERTTPTLAVVSNESEAHYVSDETNADNVPVIEEDLNEENVHSPTTGAADKDTQVPYQKSKKVVEELPGKVEESIKIDTEIALDRENFKFKDLRRALKSQRKKPY